MTVRVKDFIQNTKLPQFLSNSPILNQFDKVDKVFPGIGLPNSKEEITLNNTNFVESSAINLVGAIAAVIDTPRYRLTQYKVYYPRKNVSADKLLEMSAFGAVLGKLHYHMVSSTKLVLSEGGKVSIKLAQDICDSKMRVVFKNGESLFRVYNKIYEAINSFKSGIKIEKLDSMPEFKRFSSDNLPNDKFQVVFASDGIDGLWDITTMSERGILSCQSWDGQYKNNLVGSIVDPFVGIIYLTSGSNINSLGSKMIKRCIVRFVVNSKTKKPEILIDKMYPEYDVQVLEKFIDFIKKNTHGKFDVQFGPHIEYNVIGKLYIPNSPIHDKLTKNTNSYRDTRICYRKELQPDITKLEKNLVAKDTKFRNILRNTSFVAVSKIDADKLKFTNRNVESTIKDIVASNDFKHMVREYYFAMACAVIESVPKKGMLSSKEYFRRIVFQYLNNGDALLKKQRTSFVRSLNKYFTSKVSFKSISKALESVQASVDSKLKDELKKLLSKNVLTALSK